MSKNIASNSSKAYTDARLSLALRCNQWKVFLRKASALLLLDAKDQRWREAPRPGEAYPSCCHGGYLRDSPRQ